MLNEHFVSYIRMRTCYIPIDDNDVGFVQDQHASFDLDCASPLTEQSLYSDTLFWFRAEKQQLAILEFVFYQPGVQRG
jgi:hypothetical protein